MHSPTSILRRLLLLSFLVSPLAIAAPAAKLQVATLHPSLTDLAKQVGGDLVSLTALMKPGADAHTFSPTPGDIKSLRACRLILASGKNLESYLPKLKDNLAADQVIVEVGRSIPSLQITAKDTAFLCCPEHAAGALDPHWWNSVDNMKRAGRIVAEALAKADPANAAAYKGNATAWEERLSELKKWAKKQLSVIPQSRRILATAHLSMAYFTKEFGFKLIPVQGLSSQSKATAADVAAAISKIREHKIPAIFPEAGVNAKQLTEIIRETGTVRGGELVADGNGTGKLATFESAFRQNIETLVAALK